MDDTQNKCGYIPQELLKELTKTGCRLWIGMPRETVDDERRVALTPEAVGILVEAGHRVWIETGAGLGINYSDNHYAEAGAEVVGTAAEVYQADVILKILPPTPHEAMLVKQQATLFSLIQLHRFEAETLSILSAKRVNAIAFELLQDENRNLPVLNLISEIEGITAINIAAELMGNAHGGKGILLGGVPGVSPAEVVIIGAGHAGTSAARTARALGASVKVFDNDINNLRKIQNIVGEGLFTSNFHPNVLHNAFRSADVVIGAMRYISSIKRYLVAEDLIREMKNGALLIDLCVTQGGCFETTCCLSAKDPEIFEQYGVLHYCKSNISNQVARTTSMAVSNVLVPLFLELGDVGSIQTFARTDMGFRNGIYLYRGKLVNDVVASYFNIRSSNIDIYLSAF